MVDLPCDRPPRTGRTCIHPTPRTGEGQCARLSLMRVMFLSALLWIGQALAAPVVVVPVEGAVGPVSIMGGGGSEKDGKKGGEDTMTKKVTNDAVAYIRGFAQMRGRNADWAEKAVREAVSLPAEEALKMKVIDYIAADVPALLEQLEG